MEQGGGRDGNEGRVVDPRWRASHFPTDVPFDRTDRQNLAARRRRSLRPWVVALFTFLVLEAVIGVPLALVIWQNGGIGPGKGAPDDEYFGWRGNPTQGRNEALAALVLVGIVALGAAVWAAVLTVRQRREILRIDSRRLAHGVRGVAVPAEIDRRRDWWGRRRRRAIAEVPLLRAHHHDATADDDSHAP